MVTEMQELVCHCGIVNTFPIKTERNGNHIIVCRCGHKHCRVCENGKVTGIRWKNNAGNTYFVKSTERKYTQQDLGRADNFLSRAWLNLTR